MQKERVVKWNRDRGLLLEFNPDLERRMLSEEAREFYMAETLVCKLAEYADFVFVLEGTKAKYGCNSGIKTEAFDSYKEYKELYAWASLLRQEMYELLMDILRRAGYANESNKLLGLAYDAVCSCNELKGLDKESGKIKKGENYKDPAEVIKWRIGGGYRNATI